MEIRLRPYQKEASDVAFEFMTRGDLHGGGLLIVPTGGGKSWIIADIADRIQYPLLIFCPNKEILQQNHEKMEKIRPGASTLYSASVGKKEISKITFATIGSVKNHASDFDVFKYIIIDEAHGVNAQGGMYEEFIHRRLDRKVIGLTATPYRLKTYQNGAILKFLTRTRPRIFNHVLYHCQVTDLLSKGFLAELRYFDLTSLDLSNVRSNSTGADYDEESLLKEYERSKFYHKMLDITLRVLNPKDNIPRKGILVFTRFTKEADMLVRQLSSRNIKASIVTGTTPNKEREQIINRFRSGEIKVVANVGVLTTGFDYPELDTVILARPTKSLALYYQMVGRIIRPFPQKNGWVVDLGGSFARFGKVSDLKIGVEKAGTERWAVFSRGRQLTNVIY